MTGTPKRRYASRDRKALTVGSIAVAGVALGGCGDDFDGSYSFTTIDSCVSEGFARDVCEAEYQAALTEHAATAPRFDSRELCEQQFGDGRCNEITDARGANEPTRSFFVPFLTGYLVSSALRDFTNYNAYRTYRTSNPTYVSSPVYRDRSGRSVTTARDPATNRPVTKPLNQNTRTVARRGFGGRGSGRGWGG